MTQANKPKASRRRMREYDSTNLKRFMEGLGAEESE